MGKSKDKYHFPFNLYLNPLSKRQTQFLEDPKFRPNQRSGIGDELEEKLEQSFREVYHVLRHYDMLEREKVYDVINAKSIQHFMEAMIQHYDFRTSEMVRVLFEYVIFYLKKNKQFHEVEEIIDNFAKPLSKYFKLLSESQLQKENLDKNISKEEKNEIKKYLKKHDAKNDYKQYIFYKQRNNELIQELMQIDLFNRLQKGKLKMSQRVTEVLPDGTHLNPMDGIIKEINENEERITNLEGESFLRESQIRLLSNAYNHLEPYASRIEPLEEFDYLLKRITMEGSYIKDTDSEFNHNNLIKEFHDLMFEKYKNKKCKTKGEVILHFNSDQTHSIEIPMNEWKKEQRKFFEEKGIELDNNLNPKEKKRFPNYFSTLKYHPKWFGSEMDDLLPWNNIKMLGI